MVGNGSALLKNPAPRRIHLMDELRGFAVFCMVFYHAFYTMAYLYRAAWGEVLLDFFMPAEPFFAALFIFISGVSSDLSRSNLKRGLKLLGLALALTAVTRIAVPDEVIWFGILHFLSVCMILFGLLKPLLGRIPFTWAWPALCLILYFFTKPIPYGYLGFGTAVLVPLPAGLYATNWLAPLGFYNRDFFSSDYFPLLPWGFVFLAGTFLGRFAAKGMLPEFAYRSRAPFFSFLGRHALLVYLVHQPVIYGAAYLIFSVLSLLRR